MSLATRTIGIFPRPEGIGGVATFREKFEAALRARGIRVEYDLERPMAALLILGGSYRLSALWRLRRRGVMLVQRLDGINWVHRRRRTGWRHFLRAEYGNLVLALIRRHLAQRIVYQSYFARRWWESWYGLTPAQAYVVHNGVDLQAYTPQGAHERPSDHWRVLVVEGNLGGGYEVGLENALELLRGLQAQGRAAALMVVGRVGAELRRWAESRGEAPIVWAGSVPRSQIPYFARSAHVLFSADLHPACPNSVIEALACGLPVVAFDTGALRELVVGDAGRIVPYGGDPWKLEAPHFPPLIQATLEILDDQERFRRAARAHAEAALSLEQMVEGYLQVLLG